MRFDMTNRRGYVVEARVGDDVQLHIVTMDDAEDAGLRYGDEVELEFPGGAYTEPVRVTGVVKGVLAHIETELPY